MNGIAPFVLVLLVLLFKSKQNKQPQQTHSIPPDRLFTRNSILIPLEQLLLLILQQYCCSGYCHFQLFVEWTGFGGRRGIYYRFINVLLQITKWKNNGFGDHFTSWILTKSNKNLILRKRMTCENLKFYHFSCHKIANFNSFLVII